MGLKVKTNYQYRGLEVPAPAAVIDWISFNRREGRCDLIVGIYASAEALARGDERLEGVTLSFTDQPDSVDAQGKTVKNDHYSQLLAAHPDLTGALIGNIYALFAQLRPELFELED